MQEWSPAAQESALRWLATCVATGSAQQEVELWKVVKTGRELRCVARYLPAGIDLRLMQAQEFRRTELHRDADAATARAEEWRRLRCWSGDGGTCDTLFGQSNNPVSSPWRISWQRPWCVQAWTRSPRRCEAVSSGWQNFTSIRVS